MAERIGRPGRVRVREGDDLAGRLAYGAILCRDLAAAWAVEEPDARLACGDCLDELVRPVGRGVRGDDDLEAVGRVVEREEVLEATLDHRLLVVGGDDDADRRLPARVCATGRRRTRARAPAASGYPTCVHASAPSEPQKSAFATATARV